MELQIGQYYTATKENDNYIFLFKGVRENILASLYHTAIVWHNHNSSKFYPESYFSLDSDFKIKESSPIDIQWLDECIAFNVLVYKPLQLNTPTLWL